MKVNDLFKVCYVLNTWRWDLAVESNHTPLSYKASVLAKIEGHVFEPEDVEDIVDDIDVVDFEWFADHTELEYHENIANYIADKVGKNISQTDIEFVITKRS
jgi:hypothetical protein